MIISLDHGGKDGSYTMNAQERKDLLVTAAKVRLGIIEGVYNAKSGHPGGSLSSAEIFTYLYFKEMRIDPKDPKNPDRDRFVLSKGHCAPGLYATLANRGYFDVSELQKLRHIGAMLQRLQRTGATILIKLCFDIFDLRKMLRLAELLNMLLALFRLGLRRIDHERIVHLIVVAFVELLGKPTVFICTHREKGGRAHRCDRKNDNHNDNWHRHVTYFSRKT